MVRVGSDFEEEYPGANALATEAYANIVRTGDMLIGMHNKQASDDHRLSGTAKMALAVIEGAGEPLEPSVIAERLIITTGSMTSILDTLERRGLITRRPHPDDRRKILVDATAAATEILDELLPSLHLREERVMTRALTAAEQRELLRLIAKVQRSAAAERNEQPLRTGVRARGRGQGS